MFTHRNFCLGVLLSVTLLVSSFNQVVHSQQFSFNLVADTSTAAPGSGASFSSFQDIAIDDGQVAFVGGTAAEARSGIYLYDGGGVNVVADVFGSGGTPMLRNFRNNVSISGNEIAFFALDPGNSFPTTGRIYVQDVSPGGNLRTSVSTDTLVPGLVGGISGVTDDFDNIGSFAVSNGTVIFTGDNQFPPFPGGVYVEQNGVVSVVADSSTPIPGGNSNFDSFTGVAIDGDNLFFSHITPSGVFNSNDDAITQLSASGGSFDVSGNNFAQTTQGGIVTSINGIVSQPVTGSTLIPNRSVTFAGVDNVSLDGTNFAFTGLDSFTTARREGLYAQINGSLVTVIEEGDTLGGLIVSDINLGGFSDNQIAFGVSFTDGSEAIFTTTVSEPTSAVPEPTSGLILAAGSLLLVQRRRRKDN